MTDLIILQVPEDISARARQIAAAMAQPVEQLLLDHLKTLAAPLPVLPPDTQAELDALQHLSDDALWTMAPHRCRKTCRHAHMLLMDKNSCGAITDDEHAELEQLVERGDRLMLRKAEAAAILRQRGHTFTPKDFQAKHG